MSKKVVPTKSQSTHDRSEETSETKLQAALELIFDTISDRETVIGLPRRNWEIIGKALVIGCSFSVDSDGNPCVQHFVRRPSAGEFEVCPLCAQIGPHASIPNDEPVPRELPTVAETI